MTLNIPNSDIDKFGVKMIYPTKITNNPQEWYMHDKIDHDKRIHLRFDELNKKSNGIWELTPSDHVHPPSARIDINTTNPKAFDLDTQLRVGTDFKKNAERGYIVDPEDFRNFELTTYFKIIEILDDNNAGKMNGYGRGGLHGKDWPAGCLGACYKGVLNTQSKQSSFEKEYHHTDSPSGYRFHINEKDFDQIDLGDDGTDVWIGQKFIVYDIPGGAKCELWVDKNADESITDSTKQDWVKINELIDKGDQKGPQELASEMQEHCNCDTKNPIFAWGGPTVTWRIDNCKVQHTKVSVREIQPPAN